VGLTELCLAEKSGGGIGIGIDKGQGRRVPERVGIKRRRRMWRLLSPRPTK
jgi:hypothetical protein